MTEATYSAVATAFNAWLTMPYWNIGKRIHEEILKGKGRTVRRLLTPWSENWQ